MSVASLLLLADGRFPDGTHAHSFGLEVAVDAGRVHDVRSLAEYTIGRLWTSGRTDAATARLAAVGVDPDELDAAWCVRTPSAVARASSRSLGRSLGRTAARVVPGQRMALADGRPPVQPVAFGLLARAVGCEPGEAALASAHGTAATLSAAGLRLLSLDPFDVASILHDLRVEIDGVASSVRDLVAADDLPHTSSPFAEIDVERQASLSPRLFRS
jgi:urease accessory protein